jgi:hypothetical protein
MIFFLVVYQIHIVSDKTGIDTILFSKSLGMNMNMSKKKFC